MLSILRRACAAVFVATAACGGPVGPSEPAMPTGTILATAPNTNLWLIDAATGDTTPFTHPPDRLNPASTTLGPEGTLASGVNGSIPRSLRTVQTETGDVTHQLVLRNDIVTYASRLSPDGKQLAFASVGWVAPGEHGVATVNLASGTAQERWRAPVQNPELGLSDLQWLPGGTELLAIAFTNGSTRWITRLDLASGTLRAVTAPVAVERIASMDISRDGQVIAYALEGDGIRFINLDGSPAAGFPTDLRGTFPAFSPDGRLLAFSRSLDGTQLIDGIWFYRFSDGAMWRALPAGHYVTWVRDWE